MNILVVAGGDGSSDNACDRERNGADRHRVAFRDVVCQQGFGATRLTGGAEQRKREALRVVAEPDLHVHADIDLLVGHIGDVGEHSHAFFQLHQPYDRRFAEGGQERVVHLAVAVESASARGDGPAHVHRTAGGAARAGRVLQTAAVVALLDPEFFGGCALPEELRILVHGRFRAHGWGRCA